jgi:hypothetical protein
VVAAATVALAVAAAAAETMGAAPIAVSVAAAAEATVATAVAVAARGAAVAAALAVVVGSARASGNGSSSVAGNSNDSGIGSLVAEASGVAGVKLLATGNPGMIDPSPPTASKELTAPLEAPLMSVLEPIEIEHKQEAHKPLPISKTPLSSTLTVPVLNNRSPKMPAVPASFHMATLPEHVADPTPNEIGMESSEAMLLLLPSFVKASLLVLPSLEIRVKLLVDGDLEIDASPPAAPNKLPAVSLNTPPMSVPEPLRLQCCHPSWTQISHSQYPRHNCCLRLQFQGSELRV